MDISSKQRQIFMIKLRELFVRNLCSLFPFHCQKIKMRNKRHTASRFQPINAKLTIDFFYLADFQSGIFLISKLLNKLLNKLLKLLLLTAFGACLSHLGTSARLKFIGNIHERENDIHIRYLINFEDVKEKFRNMPFL